MQQFLKTKKITEDKKGFTLVELIVVLVILAILAAFLVPALTGYIDKAKEKKLIAECRSAVMAAQTLAVEAYAKKDPSIDIADVLELADLNGGIMGLTQITNGKVTWLRYSDGSYTITYEIRSGAELYSNYTKYNEVVKRTGTITLKYS